MPTRKRPGGRPASVKALGHERIRRPTNAQRQSTMLALVPPQRDSHARVLCAQSIRFNEIRTPVHQGRAWWPRNRINLKSESQGISSPEAKDPAGPGRRTPGREAGPRPQRRSFATTHVRTRTSAPSRTRTKAKLQAAADQLPGEEAHQVRGLAHFPNWNCLLSQALTAREPQH